MERIPCPQCTNVLINPQANAEGSFRCTNCGYRFGFEKPCDAAVQPEGGEKTQPAPSLGRPPQPSSYGAAVLAAYLVCLLLVVSALIQLFFVVPAFLTAMPTADGMPFALSYMCIVMAQPLLGVLFVVGAGCLKRSDAAGIEVAWRLDVLDQPLGKATGSDLPYMLPFMAGGGLLVMMSIMTAEAGFVGGAGTITFLLVGSVLFLIGLVAVDLRRYCWRMRWVADKLSKRARSPNPSGVVMTLMAVSLACLGLGLLITLGEMHGGDTIFILMFDGITIGVGIALLLLAVRMDELAEAWATLGIPTAKGRRSASMPPASGLVGAMPAGVGVWAVMILGAFFYTISKMNYWGSEMTVILMFLLAIGSFLAALTCLVKRFEMIARVAAHFAGTYGAPMMMTYGLVPPGRFPLLFWALLGLSTAAWFLNAVVLINKSDGMLVIGMMSVPWILTVLVVLFASQLLRFTKNLEVVARAVKESTAHTEERAS